MTVGTGAIARIASTSLALACGAAPDEVDAVIHYLADEPVADTHLGIIEQMKNAIDVVRK